MCGSSRVSGGEVNYLCSSVVLLSDGLVSFLACSVPGKTHKCRRIYEHQHTQIHL